MLNAKLTDPFNFSFIREADTIILHYAF